MKLLWTLLLIAIVGIVHSTEEFSPFLRETVDNVKKGENRYAILKLINGEETDVEFIGAQSATFADFIKDLRKTNPQESRFGFINYEYTENETPVKKRLLFLWNPEGEPAEQSLVYSSAFTSEIGVEFGVDHYIVAKTEDDLNENKLPEKLKKLPVIAVEKHEK